jgi:hypothetical protein
MSDKLDDLPKNKPHSYDDVMKALDRLHKGVLKQAALYGGKNSKLFIPQVVEGSLLQLITTNEAKSKIEGDLDEIDRRLSNMRDHVEHLASHLRSRRDEAGLQKLAYVLISLTAAISISSKY